MNKRTRLLALFLAMLLTAGMSQAAFISGISYRNFGGECGSFPNITFLSDDPGSRITKAAIDLEPVNSKFAYYGLCTCPNPSMGVTYGPAGNSSIGFTYFGFSSGETFCVNVYDMIVPAGYVPVSWAGATINVTIDGACILSGTYVGDPGFQSHAVFSGTCGNPSPPPTVVRISPNHATSGNTVHITNLEGTGFFESMDPPVVSLTTYCQSYPCVIQTPITATNVTVVSASKITCDFTVPFSSNWVGPYNIVVTNPDGQQGKLVNGFIVHPYRPLSPLPGYFNLPTDPDNDGIYEDLNANGRLDFADVVLYFNQMTWIAANEPIAAFDLNGNGRIDFADIVALFNEI
jgi:PKD repeat protein